jgi:hypothetical protein
LLTLLGSGANDCDLEQTIILLLPAWRIPFVPGQTAIPAKWSMSKLIGWKNTFLSALIGWKREEKEKSPHPFFDGFVCLAIAFVRA